MRCDALLWLTLLALLQLSAAEPMPIITGSTVVHDLTVRIGGERIAATCLLAPGIAPHDYQPVPEDARRLARARLLVINGLGFEGWFEGLVKESGFSGTVVVASAGLMPLTMINNGHHDHAAHLGDVPDPHAYHSIRKVIRYAENIRDALMVADPAGSTDYGQRATQVIADLEATDAWARKALAHIPRAQRIIITNHDALQYFAHDYGFTILAPNTALEDSQPSAKELGALVHFITQHGVKGVFLEYGKNKKIVEQVAREAGVRIGSPLYLDGVGPVGSPTGTYIGMFRTNVQSILEALAE